MKIPFNKPYLTGKEAHYLYQAVYSGKISGNGVFTKRCQHFFENRYGFKKCLLTTSCTDALEMSALLIDIQPGDEVIIPSYTFVSTANAFVLRGAKIIFADSYPHHPNIDPEGIQNLISDKTKAIVVVHYAGVACDMDRILQIAEAHNVYVIEDAAQAIESSYKGKPLGGMGHLSAFSFHETKNVIAGEGGMLVINDPTFIERAEIIWEKGTNRAAFFRGEVAKYNWVDVGSSFLPSEVIAAFLYAQLEHLESIQAERKKKWELYFERLKPLADNGCFELPLIPEYATNNAHMFYLVCTSFETRTQLIEHLKQKGVLAVFHYLSLHQSPFYLAQYTGPSLPYTDHFSEKILRLPLFFELSSSDQEYIISEIHSFFNS